MISVEVHTRAGAFYGQLDSEADVVALVARWSNREWGQPVLALCYQVGGMLTPDTSYVLWSEIVGIVWRGAEDVD